MRKKGFNWKGGEALPCFACKRIVPVDEVMRTKDKKIICEECYIPSSR